jgi:HK97 family phage major capsid protein
MGITRKQVLRDRMNRILAKTDDYDALTAREKSDFDVTNRELLQIEEAEKNGGYDAHGNWTGGPGGHGNISHETAQKANARRNLIGTDTHDLPAWRTADDKRGPVNLEARHDLKAYLSQGPDYNPTKIDFRSFDRDAFWLQLIAGHREGREYRALAEGAQSATLTGGGVIVPIEFSADILSLLRANLVFTAGNDDGTIDGPTIIPMNHQIEVIPTWTGDGANVTSYIAENTAMTPGTATLGRVTAQAWTMANVSLASRQIVSDASVNGGFASLIEGNLAAAMARGMDVAALYGTGTTQPSGILTSAYSGSIQTVSMGTNGLAPANYDQFSQVIEKVRIANEPGDLNAFTNPQVYGTYSRLKNTLNDAMHPGQDTLDVWPPRTSTAFSATETQGTSSLCSSILVANASRILLPMRSGLAFQTLTERYADALQVGFVSYIRHDWQFPYSAATGRVLGILTT